MVERDLERDGLCIVVMFSCVALSASHMYIHRGIRRIRNAVIIIITIIKEKHFKRVFEL